LDSQTHVSTRVAGTKYSLTLIYWQILCVPQDATQGSKIKHAIFFSVFVKCMKIWRSPQK
jgi:hypothetical protein